MLMIDIIFGIFWKFWNEYKMRKKTINAYRLTSMLKKEDDQHPSRLGDFSSNLFLFNFKIQVYLSQPSAY